MRPRLSLKGRALQWLAQRDQSRVELRRKLMRVVAESRRREAVDPARSDPLVAQAVVERHADADADADAGITEVDALLDWLEGNRYLSTERFAESRVHARQARFGNLRIRGELAQHAVELPPGLLRELAETELPRALDVLARRYATLPESAAERARHSRFLINRGFSPEVVHRALRQRGRLEVSAGLVAPPDE